MEHTGWKPVLRPGDLFFGLYPGLCASRLQPREALRHE